MRERQRDSQKGKVYQAEWAARATCPLNILSLPECKSLITKAYRFAGLAEAPPPEIADGRGCRNAMAYGHLRVVLPRWARTKWVVLHEAAHLILDIQGRDNIAYHGREWASLYLRLVRRFIGRKEAAVLREAYKQYRVKYIRKNKESDNGQPEN